MFKVLQIATSIVASLPDENCAISHASSCHSLPQQLSHILYLGMYQAWQLKSLDIIPIGPLISCAILPVKFTFQISM